MNNNYKDLLIGLVRKEIKIRYKNTYLGYIWSLLSPLMMASVFYFVFQVISRGMSIENYALYLVTGLFIWQFLTNSLQLGSMLFVGNAGLIKKVNFPKNMLAIAMILSEGFNFVFTLPIILLMMFLSGVYPTVYWFLIPFLLLLFGVFMYGISLFVGSINIFFRDMERIISMLMLMLFYATPILYAVDMVPEAYNYILYINPFTPFVIVWKDIVLNGLINYEFLYYCFGYTVIFYALGVYTYNKLKYKFAELV